MTNATAIIELLEQRPGESFIGIREAERKYLTRPDGKVTEGQIKYWLKTGIIPQSALGPPQPKGKPRMIDEYYVWLAVNNNYNSWKRDRITNPAAVEPDPTAKDQSLIMLPSQVVPASQRITTIPRQVSPDGTRTTRDLLDIFLTERRGRVSNGEIAASTVDQEERYMSLWCEFTPLFPWSHEQYDAYLKHISNIPGRFQRLRYLRTFYNWCAGRYPEAMLPKSPKVGTARKPRPKVLSEEEADLLIEALRKDHYPSYVLSYAIRWTGARPWELLDRRRDEITHQGTYSPGKKTKPAGPIIFPDNREVFEILMTMPEHSSGMLFAANDRTIRYERGARRIPTDIINNAYNRAIKAAGIEPRKRNGPYMFRHYFAERMKRIIPPFELAQIMRTSVEQLDRTYGMHATETTIATLNAAMSKAFAA